MRNSADDRASKVIEMLREIRTLDQLKERVGDLTPEEQEFFDSIDFNAEPTEEELEVLGDSFLEDLKERVLARIQDQQEAGVDTRKTAEYYMNLSYPILLWDRTNKQDPYWFGEMPDLPGCCADAPTPNELIEEIREAKKEWIEAQIKEGAEVPEPTAFTLRKKLV